MPPSPNPIWAVVPGRMGSARLPGKTLAELAGRPSLLHIVERLRRVPELDGISVATTGLPEDDAIARCAEEAGAAVHRGSAEDVLGRTLDAAEAVGAATIVRVTGDSPLIDPEAVSRAIGAYRRERPDYLSNFLHGHRYPLGVSVEVFATETLREAAAEAVAPREREHVTPFLYEHPERFRLLGIEPPDSQRRPDLRLTLDTAEDHRLISLIYDALYEEDPCFGLDAVLAHLDRNPELAEINRGVRQARP